MKSAESAVLIFLWSILPCALAQEIPTGFKVERYSIIWERNPFSAVKSAGPEPQPLVFDKLFMTSWLNDHGKEVISVQNSETNEVQQITLEFNQNNLRLIELHPSADPRFVQAVVSDGKHEGTVKFRLDVQPVTPKTPPIVQEPNKPNPVASQRLPHPPANVLKTQTARFPVTVPANGRPAYRINRGVPVNPDVD